MDKNSSSQFDFRMSNKEKDDYLDMCKEYKVKEIDFAKYLFKLCVKEKEFRNYVIARYKFDLYTKDEDFRKHIKEK